MRSLVLIFTVLTIPMTQAADKGPAKLTVGYQPMYSAAWSAVVVKQKELWKKYLPAGSTVEFVAKAKGALVSNELLTGKFQLGYVGDMPGIVATTKKDKADIRIIGVVGLAYDQCNILLIRSDAPKFGSSAEALKWLGGKNLGVAYGSCADRYLKEAVKSAGIRPAAIEDIAADRLEGETSAKKLDAVAWWEPMASKLELDGKFRRVSSGKDINKFDTAVLIARNELIESRPEIVKAWMQAEFDAETYLADPKNQGEMIAMLKAETGLQENVIKNALYSVVSSKAGGADFRLRFPYTISTEAKASLADSTRFLKSIATISIDKIRDEALVTRFADEVLSERGKTSPVAEIKGQ